ncbi:MAG: O-antigen ligase family protein [Thermoflexales bacterium]|nr:O-antigen ligase family protein [Thermoflexales bacterium]
MASLPLPRGHAHFPEWAVVALCAALAGVGIGAAAVFTNPLFLVAGVGGALVAAWGIADLRRALFLLVVVIGVLPRFALPVRFVFTPTFLDLALIGVWVAWVLRPMLGKPALPLQRFPITLPLLALVLVAVITFVIGLPNGALTPLVLRRFVELLLSLLSVLLLASVIAQAGLERLVVRLVVLIGGLSALIGIALYLIPDDLAIRALSALRPFGYPTGPEVLRFIRDDPALMQRATGLWIDPNAFGGFLLVVGAIGLPQAFARRPLLPRGVVVLCLAAIVLALGLTVSRGAMLAFAAAAALVGMLRYRSVLALLALGIGLVLVLPQTRDLVVHFVEGFQGRDLATQMRFGEYKDALRLIERYPLFGVGFISTPDVDLYIGVSSMYLLIAQQMGLVGLLAFAGVILVLFAYAARAWRSAAQDDARAAVFLGAHAAVVGVLIGGIFDHYFFSIDFHNAVMLFCLALALAAASQQTHTPCAR